MHKITITFLRIWIGLTSLGAFIFGWVVFANTPKPGAAVSQDTGSQTALAPLPTLPAIEAGPGQLQPLPSLNIQPSVQFNLPVFRTRAS